MDVRLPNGTVIKGVPEGTDKAAIQAKAISAGLASEADFTAAPPPPAAEKPAEPTFLQRAEDLAGGVNRAIFDVVDLPANLVNAVSQTAGSDFRIGSVADAHPLLQRTVDRAIPEGQDALADTLRTGAEWGGTAVMPSRWAYKVPDILSAIGAMSGEAIGGETGEMIGGITGAFSPAGIKSLQKLKQMLSSGKELTPEMQQAVEFLMKNTDNPEKAMENLTEALKRDEKGTLSDLTRDPQQAVAEQALIRQDAGMRERVAPVHAGREAQTAQMYDSLKPETAGAAAPSVAKGRLNRTLEAIEERKQSGQQLAEQGAERRLTQSLDAEARAASEAETKQLQAEWADRSVGGTGRTDISSKELATEHGALATYLRDNLEKPAWEAFDKAPPVEIKQLQTELAKAIDGMPRAMADDLVQKYRGTLKHIGRWRVDADPKEVQYVLSAIKDINNNAKATGNYDVLNKQLGELGDIIDSRLRDPNFGVKEFQDAVAATKLKHQLLGGPQIAKAALKDPELFMTPADFKGQKGSATLKKLMGSGADGKPVQDAAEAHLRNIIRNEGFNDRTLIDYAPALDHFPDLRKQLEAIPAAQADAATAADKAKQVASVEGASRKETTAVLKRALGDIKSKAGERGKKVKGLTLAKYAGSPNKYIKSLLKADDDAGELGTLFKRLEREGAAPAFKAHVFDLLKERTLDIDSFSSKQGKALMADLDRLTANGVLTKDDVADFVKIVDRSEGRRLRRSGGKMDTPDAIHEMVDDMASTAATLPVLSVLPSSHQLMAAGMLKRNIKRILQKGHYDPQIMRHAEDFIKNPARLKDALDGKLRPDMSLKELDAAMMGVTTGLAHYLDKRED